MKNLKDKVAAVTGAASGIGRMLAVNLAKKGCHLAISDVDTKGLAETAEMARGSVNVTTHVVNVADRKQVYRYADDVVKKHGGVDIIINNAGVANVDSMEDITYEDMEWLLGINFWGVVYGTRAFLPHLKKRPEGHIVNIASINAMIPFPYNGPYNISKHAVTGLSETLWQELAGTSVRVSCVHPGGIRTNIARNARFRKLLDPNLGKDDAVRMFDRVATTSADRAARVIIAGIRKKKRRIMVGADARIMDLMKRIFPVMSVLVTGALWKRVK